jgi:type I pullulanase
MKTRRLISFLLVVLLLLSAVSVAVSAYDADLAGTGYYNQTYLEDYAAKAYNETDLGAVYTPSATTFKVWAPEATSVEIKLYTTGTDAESGAAVLGTEKMTYNSISGIWSATLSGDYKNRYYTYIVNRGGVIKETQDPYAKAVGANGNRSMVVDLDGTDPDGWNSDSHVFFDNPGEAVVWEVHVRDFSIDVSSGVSDANKGKYLAFTEGNTTVGGKGKVASCVDYLVEHNVNCVQLMPIEDFASIDETDDAIKRNWGYDPKNYNVPEGSYSSDPYNGNTRITEFKMLVQALHDRGIAVVMDVVYNHTFVLEGSALNMTTPNYYYRKSSDENYHNGSGLGNVLASEKKMVSKYISDSLLYWVNEYHIDGFRFDLMGCHDVNNMKTWRSNLDKVDTRILMYGEPWTGGSDNGIGNGINNTNLNQITRVGGFNEGFSDSLKGDHSVNTTSAQGFVTGGDDSEIRSVGAGQSTYLSGCQVNQFINYVDNHDNLTAFDKILASTGASGYKAGKDGKVTGSTASLYDTNKNAVNNPSTQVLSQMKLALTAALTSQGIPFTVAGTEFCRTKYGDANSYRSVDEINAIDWNRAATYSAVSDYYAGLISIRKAVNAFTNSSSVSTTSVSGCTAWQITNNTSGQWNKVIVALNNQSSAKSISLSGTWTVVADGTTAGTTSLGTASGSYSVPAYSGVVLVDSASFGNYKQPNPGTSTVIVEHYTRDSESGEYSKIKTETAKFKEGQTWRASKNLAILFDHNFDKVESTAAGNATYGSVTAGTTTTVKFYYTRYIKSAYLVVNFYNTVDGARIKTPMKYHLRDGDGYSIPATAVQGYELDTTRYPGMTIGTFDASNPISFNFYYKALTNNTTRVHYYNAKKWAYVLCYAYDDNGIEALGAWPDQKKKDAMKKDNSMGDGWVVIDVPTSSCYVMFHHPTGGQVPGQGEKGYTVSGEAWIKDGIVSFNNKIVTSHVDLETGKQVSADVTKQYTNVSSNQTYTTAPVNTTGTVIVPANATGYYQAGITNVVYLYQGGEIVDPTPGGKTLMGDADGDKKVTIIDATRIQRVLAGLEQKTAGYDVAADVDMDGKVTIIDATCIQRYLAGLTNASAKVDVWVGGGEEPTEEPTQPPVTPTEPPENRMYLSPSDEWKEAGARFAAYFFDDEDNFEWINMKYAGPGLYYVDIPDGYDYVIFCRMNGASTDNNWDNKWNQTEDLNVEPGETCYVEGWGS